MEEWPSFRRRVCVRRLVLALVLPWLLMILAYSLPLLVREMARAGYNTDWKNPTIYIWFYGFGFPALFTLVGFFLFGLWQLLWWREYRRSWYGWAWTVLTYLNMGALVTVETSKAVKLM